MWARWATVPPWDWSEGGGGGIKCQLAAMEETMEWERRTAMVVPVICALESLCALPNADVNLVNRVNTYHRMYHCGTLSQCPSVYICVGALGYVLHHCNMSLSVRGLFSKHGHRLLVTESHMGLGLQTGLGG